MPLVAPKDSSRDLHGAIPRVIGPYDVLGEVGRGGMGVVYRVRDRRTQQMYALKMIPPELIGRAENALRFKREFRAMQRVEHPNVIRVFELGTHDNCPYFTMEFIDGKDIRRWLDGDDPIIPINPHGPPPAGTFTPEQRARLNNPMRLKRLCDAVIQVGFALSAIHAHRIVHRDLKPDNILVSGASVVKMMDFGIAKQLNAPGGGEHSTTGLLVGTYKYLSPEQALGKEVDGRADLYCLGLILYELLVGRHPFYSENSVGYAYHHAKKQPPPLERFNPEVDAKLKAICERLLKKEPSERFATAEDVIAALRDAMDGRFDDSNIKVNRVVPLLSTATPYELARDALFQPALAGRDKELRTLIHICEHLGSARSHVGVVVGVHGMGKSRLIRELAAQARARGVELSSVQAETGSGPYQCYRDLLDQIVSDITEAYPGDVAQILGADGPVLARYVPSIDMLPDEIRPLPAPALDPENERIRFFSSVTSFLVRFSTISPHIIVIDDLHFADPLSLALTRHLTEQLIKSDTQELSPLRASPLSLIATIDPQAEKARAALQTFADVSTEKAFIHVPLGALAPNDVRDMIATMTGGGGVAQALADALHQESGGVPAVVQDQVRAWVESGELVRRGRQWALVKKEPRPTNTMQLPQVSAQNMQNVAEQAPVAVAALGQTQEVPQHTAEIVQQHFDKRSLKQMTEDEQRLVEQVAADAAAMNRTLGTPATVQPTTPAANTAPIPPVVDLRSVTRADIPLRSELVSPGERRLRRLSPPARDVAERAAVIGDKVFMALLMRVSLRPEDSVLDAVDEMIKRNILVEDEQDSCRFASTEDRQAILDNMSPARRQALHQLVLATLEDEERQVRHDGQRGQRTTWQSALASVASPDALARHCRAAGQPVRAIDYLIRAAQGAMEVGATQSAAEYVKEAQELLSELQSHTLLSNQLMQLDLALVILRMSVFAAIGEHRECISLAQRRLSRLTHYSVDPKLLGEILLRMAASERILGELEAALVHVGRALAITERGGAHSLRCRAKALCGALFEQQGRYDLSQQYYNETLELARTIGDDIEEERARLSIARQRLTTGHLDVAQQDLLDLLERAKARGEKVRMMPYFTGLGIIAAERGNFDEAEEWHRRVIEIAKPAGDRRNLAIGLYQIGCVRKDQAKYDEAVDLGSRAGRIFRDIKDVEGSAQVLLLEAQVSLEKKEIANALAKAADAQRHARQASAQLAAAEASLCYAHAAAHQGRTFDALYEIEVTLTAARAASAQRLALYGVLVKSDVLWRAERLEEAWRLAEEGARVAELSGLLRYAARFRALLRTMTQRAN